jgi:hypothetical protein
MPNTTGCKPAIRQIENLRYSFAGKKCRPAFGYGDQSNWAMR